MANRADFTDNRTYFIANRAAFIALGSIAPAYNFSGAAFMRAVLAAHAVECC